jgi:hypothetical protein
MDRTLLESWLAEGLSLEQMGARAGRHPSTVSYWLRKHGLTALGAEVHAARGALDRDELRALVDAGLSVRGIAHEVGRSTASVRHWLAVHGLETRLAATRRLVAQADGADLELICRHHGRTAFRIRGYDGQYRCLALSVRAGHRAPPPRPGATGRRGRRCLRAVRVSPVHRRAALPPSGSGHQELRARRRRDEVARAQPGRGFEMRPVVLELPRGGRGGTQGPPLTCRLQCPARPFRASRRSGVAQWQSIRLLIEGLWVRVPPPELRKPPRRRGFRVSRAAIGRPAALPMDPVASSP